MIDAAQLRMRAVHYRGLAETAKSEDMAEIFLILAQQFDAEADAVEDQVRAAVSLWKRPEPS